MPKIETETREQFLGWAKKRAIEYVDRGDLIGAVASLCSDLRKRDDCYGPGVAGALAFGVFEIDRGPLAIRRWIEGFQ